MTSFPLSYGGVTYEAICGEVMGKVQAEQLRRLIGFTFTRHPHLNLPEDRLKAIERHLQKRVRFLLELPRTRDRENPAEENPER